MPGFVNLGLFFKKKRAGTEYLYFDLKRRIKRKGRETIYIKRAAM